tara:strand:- start:1328 stop:2191 length:864 start_codon:yes stop_codon:yes gene_type:complete
VRLIIILILFSSKLYSQDIKYKTYFLDKEVKLGDSIKLISIINYPIEIELIQPDSTYDFSPFNFIGKKIFQSKFKKDIVYDSTIYYLRTFEVDSIQSLNLNSYILKDSLKISSKPDTIYFQSLVNNVDENVKNNFTLNNILSIFNTYKILSFLSFIILTIFILYITFRKKIKQYLKRRRLIKNLNDFINNYEILEKSMNKNNDKKTLEKIILYWKRYMETISTFPYSTSTTKEILNFNKDDKLEKTLVDIDRVLYSDKKFNCKNLSLKYLIFIAEIKTNNLVNNIKK